MVFQQPMLSDLRNELNKEYNELQTRQADLDHEIQKQNDAIATKQSGLEEINRQINDLNIAYEEEKKVNRSLTHSCIIPFLLVTKM